MDKSIQTQGGKMRLKVLLIILGVVIVGGIFVLYFWGPLGEAKPAWKCGYSIQLTANPDQVEADGTSQSKIVATVSQGKGKNHSLVSGETVSFSSTMGTLSAAQATTDSNGQAKVFISSSRPGVASIRAQLASCVKFVETQFVIADETGTGLFSDDFSGDLSKWEIVYTGYGQVKIENSSLMMAPMVSTSPGETHAPLVAAKSTNWQDYTLTMKMRTAQQLRTGSAPNPWEVGWILFRYQDTQHFYYLIYKPNGVELGKFVNGQQTFLATPGSPKMTIGSWDNYKVVVKGTNIQVYINGSLVINYTDNSSPLLNGRIGLYNEDAKVYYDDVVVTE